MTRPFVAVHQRSNGSGDQSMCSAYLKRLCYATISAFAVVLGLYAFALRGADWTDATALRANDGALVGSEALHKTTLSAGSVINAQTCPKKKPMFETEGKPVWVSGYPGSGFDVVGPLIAAFTGLSVSDVYRQHSCSMPIQKGAPPTSACMTHWPLVSRDSPAALAVRGELYANKAVFIIRNPSAAIVGYHTRWWGAQKHVQNSHEQPLEADWQSWRDQRFDHHLTVWKRSLTEWQRGVPAAGILGISMYLAFEELVNPQTGPSVVGRLAEQFQAAHHIVATNTACLWHRIVEKAANPKQYTPSYTVEQQHLMISMLDELIVTYQAPEPALTAILQRYRTDIQENLRVERV